MVPGSFLYLAGDAAAQEALRHVEGAVDVVGAGVDVDGVPALVTPEE